MSRRSTTTSSLLGAMLAATLAAAAHANMQEGNWEVTAKMEIVGMPFAMPPTTHNQCVTKKDLVPDMAQQDQSCIVQEQKVVGDTVSWRIQCKGKDGTMDGEGRIKYAGKTYTGEMQMRMKDRSGEVTTMKTSMQGKHTGACGANSKKAKRADDY
jgi:ubiquitin